jgi:hypothetical protein
MSVSTAKVTLVTIIAGNELEDRVSADLKALGVKSFTRTRAEGRGMHGPRTFGFVDDANVRIETLVASDLAGRILAVLVDKYVDDALLAFTHEVEAIPQKHFLRS